MENFHNEQLCMPKLCSLKLNPKLIKKKGSSSSIEEINSKAYEYLNKRLLAFCCYMKLNTLLELEVLIL